MKAKDFEGKDCIDIAFKQYMKCVHGSNWDIKLSKIQIRETKFAFFAGFQECLSFVSEVSSLLNEDDACKVLNKIQAEINKFKNDVIKEVSE